MFKFELCVNTKKQAQLSLNMGNFDFPAKILYRYIKKKKRFSITEEPRYVSNKYMLCFSTILHNNFNSSNKDNYICNFKIIHIYHFYKYLLFYK